VNASELQKYARMALDSGATQAKIIQSGHVEAAEWVRFKCQYGCSGFGKRLHCPPRTPKPDTTRRMLNEYQRALIYTYPRPDDKRQQRKWQRLLASIERQAFLDGFYKAFGMSAGPCRMCAECDPDGQCSHPEVSRPAMEACGIDVYATCRNAGIKLHVVTSRDEPAKYVNLVLID
jgi:predicted metal-binding protein